MSRCLPAAALSALLLLLPATASARDYAATARNVVPSGQWGSVPVPPGADSQAKLYDSLTPRFDQVTTADLTTSFKSEHFGVGPEGPAKTERVPGLRMILIAGPRVDPASLPQADGLEAQGYVHRLYRQLAACDLAITHGGLATTMEVTAAGRPFLTFQLRDHFEQNRHVAHRLDRHGAGRRMDYHRDGPSEIAAAIAEEIGRTPTYRPVETRGAARAAEAISELL